MKQGVMVAARHLHLSATEAKKLQLKGGDIVAVKINGPRALVLNHVVVRCGVGHKMALQIDTDEGNACGWKPGMTGELIK
jgi:propanediol utilization protein